jgi:hypothetical protein
VAGHTGTIVKTRYSRGLKAALLLAKGHVRYAVHRCNEQGQRQYREVWDRDGSISKLGAYERIDRVHKDDYVYRLMLSPHPEHQDAARQIDLKEWTHQMMRQLEQDFGRRVDWFAVSHEHPEHRPSMSSRFQSKGLGSTSSARSAKPATAMSSLNSGNRRDDSSIAKASDHPGRRERMVVTGT